MASLALASSLAALPAWHQGFLLALAFRRCMLLPIPVAGGIQLLRGEQNYPRVIDYINDKSNITDAVLLVVRMLRTMTIFFDALGGEAIAQL